MAANGDNRSRASLAARRSSLGLPRQDVFDAAHALEQAGTTGTRGSRGVGRGAAAQGEDAAAAASALVLALLCVGVRRRHGGGWVAMKRRHGGQPRAHTATHSPPHPPCRNPRCWCWGCASGWRRASAQRPSLTAGGWRGGALSALAPGQAAEHASTNASTPPSARSPAPCPHPPTWLCRGSHHCSEASVQPLAHAAHQVARGEGATQRQLLALQGGGEAQGRHLSPPQWPRSPVACAHSHLFNPAQPSPAKLCQLPAPQSPTCAYCCRRSCRPAATARHTSSPGGTLPPSACSAGAAAQEEGSVRQLCRPVHAPCCPWSDHTSVPSARTCSVRSNAWQ